MKGLVYGLGRCRSSYQRSRLAGVFLEQLVKIRVSD